MLLRAPPPLVGRAALRCGPLLGGARCVGACPPSCWGVLCWCPPAAMVVFGLGCPRLVGGLWLWLCCSLGPGWSCAGACPPPPVGACHVCAYPPPWWGLLCRRVRVSVRGVVAAWMLGLFCWFAVISVAVRPALSGVCCLWCLRGRGRCCVGACSPLCWGVPCLCVAPHLLGPAVSACSDFGSWCCSRLDARLVLSVCCCLRRRTAGVVGCCLFGVFSWQGRTGRPPERVRCATPLSWPGRTGRPPERVRCATPCFCFAGVVALLLEVLCWLVSVRFLALRRCLSPPAAVPPPPTPTRPSACCVPPPPRFLVPPQAVPPPPLPGGMPFPAGCLAPVLPPCWRFLLPPPSRVLFPGCWPLPLVFPCPPASALFFPCLWPGHLFGWVTFSPLGSCWCPPPPGGCSWWSAVPRVLFCGAVVGCRLLCAARRVLLRRAVLLCACLAVWCPRLLCRWPSPVGVDHALSVGVAGCSASPRCFVRCFVVCGAVVHCRVLRCFPCCSVVSWLFSLCLLGFAHLRVCAAWCCPPPPVVCVSCLLPVCVAAVCWLVLPFVVPCCCLLCCVVRGAACRVVWCRVLLCSAGGVVLRCVSSCGCVLLRALPCSVVLCCVVVRCPVRWGAASWCSVLCCHAVCCCGSLCAVWCPLALCGWLRAVLRCCFLLRVVLRLLAWCLVALCRAVLVVACCFVLVALPCAVLCLLVLCWAVSR